MRYLFKNSHISNMSITFICVWYSTIAILAFKPATPIWKLESSLTL